MYSRFNSQEMQMFYPPWHEDTLGSGLWLVCPPKITMLTGKMAISLSIPLLIAIFLHMWTSIHCLHQATLERCPWTPTCSSSHQVHRAIGSGSDQPTMICLIRVCRLNLKLWVFSWWVFITDPAYFLGILQTCYMFTPIILGWSMLVIPSTR